MPDIISDFADIKRRANLLKGGDEHYAGTQQSAGAVTTAGLGNVTTAIGMHGMAGNVSNAQSGLYNPYNQGCSAGIAQGSSAGQSVSIDTAPCEYAAADFDGA